MYNIVVIDDLEHANSTGAHSLISPCDNEILLDIDKPTARRY